MADADSHFHFALARITATQVLRSTGVDRARPSVVDSLTDLLVRYISLLGERSRDAAELSGRHKCELEDLRSACESIGAFPTSYKHDVRDEEGIVGFISWCMSDEVGNIRRIAGEGEDDLGEGVTVNWLADLVQKQIKATEEDKFLDTVLKGYSTDADAVAAGERIVPNVYSRDLDLGRIEIGDPDTATLELLQNHVSASKSLAT